MFGKVLNVALMGNPVLGKKCRPVLDPLTTEVQELISDMKETIRHRGCLGIAAPQVFCPIRLVVYHIPIKVDDPETYDLTPEYDPEGVPPQVLINPEITPLSDKMSEGWEGCQSVPGLLGLVERYHSIHLKAMDEKGRIYEKETHGFHSRIIQHECDHLDGILFPHKLKDPRMFGYYEEVLKYLK